MEARKRLFFFPSFLCLVNKYSSPGPMGAAEVENKKRNKQVIDKNYVWAA